MKARAEIEEEEVCFIGWGIVLGVVEDGGVLSAGDDAWKAVSEMGLGGDFVIDSG